MTTAAPGSTADSRAAALAMFEGRVPCFMSLVEPPCPEVAKWLVWFAHEENTAQCLTDEPLPACAGHKHDLQASSHPFWRTWHQMQPVLCIGCGTPLRVDRFEPL